MAAQAVVDLLLQDKRFKAAIKDAMADADKLKKKVKGVGDDPFAGFSRGAKSLTSNLAGATKAAGALAAAAAGVAIGFAFKKAVEEARNANREISNAANAMARSGEYSRAAMADIQAFSDSMLATKGVASGLAMDMFTLAKSYGLSNDEAKKVVSVSADVAQATGKDLKTAVEQVSASFNGKVGALAKLNPALAKLTQTELEAGKAADMLGKTYAGAAAASLQTFDGAVNQTTESLSDMLGELGNAVVDNPVVIRMIRDMGAGFRELGEYIKDNEDELRSFVNENLIDLTRNLGHSIRAFGLFTAAVSTVKASFSGLSEDVKDVSGDLYKNFNAAEKVTRGFVLMGLAYAKVRQFMNERLKPVSSDPLFIKQWEDGKKAADDLVESLEDLRKKLEVGPGMEDKYAGYVKSADSATSATDKLADAILDVAANMDKINGKKASVFIEPKNAGGTGGSSQSSPYDYFAGSDQSTAAVSDAMSKHYQQSNSQMSGMIADIGNAVIGGMNQGGTEGAASTIGGVVGAVLTPFLGPFGQMIGKLLEFAMQDPEVHDQKLQSYVEGFPKALENLNTNMESMPRIISEGIGPLINQLITGFPDFISALGKAGPSIGRGIAKTLPGAIADAFKELFSEFIGGWKYHTAQMARGFSKINLNITGFQNGAHAAGTRFSDAVKSIGGKFKASMGNISESIKKGISDATREMGAGMRNLMNGISFEWGRLKEGLGQIGPKLEGSAQKAGNWLSERARTAGNWLSEAGGKIASGWQTVLDKLSGMGDKLGGIGTAIEDYFTNKFPETLNSIGREISDAWKDIGNAASDFDTKIREAAQAFMDKITNSVGGGAKGTDWSDASTYDPSTWTGMDGAFGLNGDRSNVVPLPSSALAAGSSGGSGSTRSAPAAAADNGDVVALLARLVKAAEGGTGRPIEVKIDGKVLGRAINDLNYRNTRMAG